MTMMSGQEVRSKGFTLIELLVVIAIITLLLGILSPAIHAMAVKAKSLKAKSQLNSIDAGLEFFEKRYGAFPESASVNDGESGDLVNGAQHLAEAMVGRDQRGFDPKSWWHASDPSTGQTESTIRDLYRNDETTTEGKKSLARRIGPFVELKETGLFTVDQIYGAAGAGIHSDADWNQAYVLTDVFRAKKIELLNGEKVKVGTPILYYKAREGSTVYNAVKNDYDDLDEWIYNYYDNLAFTGDQDVAPGSGLPVLKDENEEKVLTIAKFYEMITNPQVSYHDANYQRPYNVNSYLLISAGWDGVYGTRDDVTNFDY